MAKRKSSAKRTPAANPGAAKVVRSKIQFFPTQTKSGIEATGPYAGGGHVPFRVKSFNEARKILAAYKGAISFYQVGKAWKVTAGGSTKTYRGYSPMAKANSVGAGKPSDTYLKRMLLQTQVSAIRKATGAHLDYEGNQADRLKPAEATFLLLIWFTAKHRARFEQLA